MKERLEENTFASTEKGIECKYTGARNFNIRYLPSHLHSPKAKSLSLPQKSSRLHIQPGMHITYVLCTYISRIGGHPQEIWIKTGLLLAELRENQDVDLADTSFHSSTTTSAMKGETSWAPFSLDWCSPIQFFGNSYLPASFLLTSTCCHDRNMQHPIDKYLWTAKSSFADTLHNLNIERPGQR